MKKLQEANLYRSELIPINGKLVERYNQCLKKLGFKPTKLKLFSIDGLGWSPELAEERKDLHYLNNGEANPHAIIITPLQKGKPVYVPFHTFDRDLMKFVFKSYGSRISDITRDSAVCIDFDQQIDAYYEPLDILKYKSISIGFRLINDIDKHQREQLELIEVFKRGNNFIDEHLHGQLLESAKTHGDLRRRELILESLDYTTDSFYTKAFGGVYVLRDFISPILVFEDEKWHKEAIKDIDHEIMIFHISQPELVVTLRDHMIIETDLDKVVKSERYSRIKKFMLSEHLKDAQHPVKEILDNKILFKSYLNKIDIKALKKVNGVELYLERLERSNAYKIKDMIDDQFYFALHEPHSSLPAEHQDLIWRLLVNIAPRDVLYLYWYDKEQFYKSYQDWDPSLQEWVIDTISNKIQDV